MTCGHRSKKKSRGEKEDGDLENPVACPR